MPNISGQIEYSGFTLFLSVPMVELRQSPTPIHQMLAQSMEHAVGITTDPEAEGSDDFVNLIVDFAENFMEHVMDSMPAGTPAIGMIVWEGGATIDSQKEVTFQGTLRRPTPDDFAAYARIIERADEAAKENLMEHAKHCRVCAEKMGLDPSEVVEVPADEIPGEHGVWFVRDVGEA